MDEEIEEMMMNYCSRRLTCVLTLSGNRMIVPKDRRQDSENICSLVDFPRMSTGWKPLMYSFKGSYQNYLGNISLNVTQKIQLAAIIGR